MLGNDIGVEGGQVLRIDSDKVVNKDVANYFSRTGQKVNTWSYEEQSEFSDWLISTGAWNDAGFWRDEENWIDNP